MARVLKIKKVKKFYWQVYRPKTFIELLCVPWFKRIVVDYKYWEEVVND
jgi:hypothetical protein